MGTACNSNHMHFKPCDLLTFHECNTYFGSNNMKSRCARDSNASKSSCGQSITFKNNACTKTKREKILELLIHCALRQRVGTLL